MARIAALNDLTVGSSDEDDVGPTREALEAEASKNYNEAIRSLACGRFDVAYNQFCLVLENPFIEKACWPEGVEPGGALPQDLALRYSCLKNMGNLSSKRGEYDQSVEYYMEAVRLDRTDVTIWQRLGAAAIKLKDFELALVAFQEGYNVNHKHWPCLDQLLSVLFILKMYTDCLGLAIYTLQRDPGYIKALAFKDKIFEIQPSLKEEVKFFFRDSSVLFGNVNYDKAKGDKFIATCETLRPPNKIPQPLPTIPCQRIRKPLGNLSWEDLAKSLVSTYDALMEEDGMAFAGRIDVFDALNDVKAKAIESEMEELGVTPLEIVATVGRKDRKSTDDPQENPEGKESNTEKDRNPFDGIQGPPIRISGRRRTIELGESQDSFRVSEKRRSIDSDASRPEDAKSNDGAAMAVESGGVSKDESQKEKSAEEEKEKEVNKKEMEDHRSQDKSGSHNVERPAEDDAAMTVQGIKKPMEEDLKKHVGANVGKQAEEGVGKQAEEGVEKQVNCNDDVGKEEREHSNVQNLEASGEKMESSNAKPSPTDEESDNDFQGFTNASAYKEKHLKLVQGKSALCVIDEEDFGMEPGDEVEGQVQGTDSVGKEFNDPGLLGAACAFSSEREKDLRIEEVSGREDNPNDTEPPQCQVEEEDIVEKTDLLQEETEIESQAEEYVEKVGNGNEVGDATGQGEYENRTVEEVEQCGEEGQEVSEGGGGGGGMGDVNEGDGVEEEQDEGEDQNVETGGDIEHTEGEDHIEENDDVGMDENEGGMEENEGGMEENEGGMEELEGVMEENDCGIGENVCEMERNEGDIEENDEGILDEGEGENEGYQEEEEGMEDDGMLSTEVTETEAAVNALKGIMALQPTEILGLPEPDFDYENEYVEYFDGGVYEEEEDMEEEEEEEEMNQGEDEHQEDEGEMPEIDESQENTDQDMEGEEECDNGERMQQEDSSQEDDEGEHDGESRDREAEEEDNQQGTENIEKENNDGIEDGRGDKGNEQVQKNSETGKEAESKNKSNGDREKERGASSEGEIFNVDKDNRNKNTSAVDKRSTDEDDTTTAEASNKAGGTPSQTNMEVARKSKRTKRGLERELEQLDYWGRRQERDAKRRRRTISSKLLGAIEEAEYLTWADLLRSFVPSALLNIAEDKKKKGSDEKSINSKSNSQTASVTSSGKDVSVTPSKETSSGATAEVKSQDKSAEGKDTVLMNGRHSNKDTNGELSVGGDAKSMSHNVEKVQEEIMSNVPETKSPKAEKVPEEDKCKEDEKAAVTAEEERDKIGIQSVVDDDTLLLSSSSEEAQVQAFLMRYKENGGILHLLQQFLRILLKRHKDVWPTAVAKMFTEAYPRVRNHVSHGSPLNLNERRERLHEESMLSLTHWELCCSIYQSAKLTTPVGDQSTLPNPFTDNPEHLEDDMFRLVLMLGRGDVWVEETPQFHTRLRWLQAQIRLIRGQPEDAVSYLELLISDLDRLANEGLEYICNRARTELDTIVVCNSEVKRQLNVLQRSHMLEQVVANYTDCRYRDVADLLTTIFHEPLPKCRPGVTLPTRQTQLAILIDSLYKLSEYKDVMTWGSHSITEALMRYNRAEADEEKSRWAKTLMKTTETMNTMLTNDITVVCDVDRERLVEVVSTLIRMLVVQLERPQSVNILPFETLTPWMLLHRLLAYEESLQDPGEIKKANVNSQLPEGLTALPKTTDCASMKKGSQVHENTDKEGEFKLNEIQNTVKGVVDVDIVPTSNADGGAHGTRASSEGRKRMPEMPIKEWASIVPSKGPVTPYPSTLFLITAHDELGKHSWCCYDEGTFLLYCLDVLLVELRRLLDDQHRQLLHHTLEQVTFCLYSHPSKKSKHKHLRDHGVPQIAFCWERAMQLYQYYRPNVLPDFQTSQIPSITDDAAVLFKRIIALLPDEAKPSNQTSGVEAYINGEVAECNYSPFSPPTDIISDCFYLLGDYYFKSKEWMNAIKYYKLDLSINHERLESWAPLGLAMKAMLESQLNSCEVIEDEEAFFSLAKAAVQCLRQALKLDQYHTNLWVEFGGLVYMVHSHASRLLKQDLNPDISLETFDMLEKLKNEMLNQSEHCFTKALSIQEEEGWDDEGLPDERWLHCYMLGKVAEKMSKPPQVIIQYYMKAARYLHNIQAKYPVRISYNSPQEFSVEALEMYYRVHAFMLKYLHQREGRDVEPEIMDSFIKFLDELAVGPFTNCQEKKNENAIEANTADNDDVLTIDDDDNKQRKRPLEEDEEEGEPASKRLQNDTASKDEETDPSDKKQDAEVTSKNGIAKDGKAVAEKEKESDDEIQVVEEKVIEKKDHFVVISRCLTALRTCLSRFQEHYKAMYRLAQYYHTSKFHKDNNKAQNYLLGCQLWQNVGYMPVNGLFNERKVWIQQPKNCNFFHGVWRIPNDEIDRPGSFAAHMYRCVSLILDILPQMKDFFMILQIALALKNSPDKDKKYLRDNERELLSEHATQVGLQAMKDKYKVLFKASSPVHGNRHLRFLLDVYKSYKQISKHLPGSEPHFAKMLTDTYASYKNIKVENRSNVLREADCFCNRQQYLQHRSSGPTSNMSNPVSKAGNFIQSSVIGRRGRPPLTGRGRGGRGRGAMYNTGSRTVGDMLAVQQAYKIYESLINTQTLLNKKGMNQANVYSYQKQLEGYQAQLMKYLTIPCVSQYFQSSLQGLGTTTTKLPPPKVASSNTGSTPSGSTGSTSGQPGTKPNSNNDVTSMASPGSSVTVSKGQSTQPGTARPSLSALAARSQAHGISITSVSPSKLPSTQNQPLKPSMSVTVSPVKSTTTCPPPPPALKGRDVSVVAVSHSSTTTVKASSSVSLPKTETNKLPSSTDILPSSTTATFKSATSSATSTTFKASSSSSVISTTFKPISSAVLSSPFKPLSSSSGGSTTFKPLSTSGGSTTFKPLSSTSGGSTFKPATSSGSSVPKLPAGTTLTRPRDISSSKGSSPHPQLQANPPPVKDAQPDNVSTAVKKVISSMSGSSAPVSKPNESSTRSDAVIGGNKPTLPKGMTITPAPRIKTQPRQQMTSTRPTSSPSTSFFRAFEASLGLSSSKNLPERTVSASPRGASPVGNRTLGRGQTTSISNAAGRVKQLSTKELMQLAYGSERGQASGGHGQTAGGHGQTAGGHGQTAGGHGQTAGGHGQTAGGHGLTARGGLGQTSNSVSTLSAPYSKSSQQQRGQATQPNSSQLPQGSTLVRIQSTLPKAQTTSGASQPQASGSQQQSSNPPQQPRTNQQSSNVSQSKTVPNSNPSKPSQKPSNSSDDIITLD